MTDFCEIFCPFTEGLRILVSRKLFFTAVDRNAVLVLSLTHIHTIYQKHKSKSESRIINVHQLTDLVLFMFKTESVANRATGTALMFYTLSNYTIKKILAICFSC